MWSRNKPVIESDASLRVHEIRRSSRKTMKTMWTFILLLQMRKTMSSATMTWLRSCMVASARRTSCWVNG